MSTLRQRILRSALGLAAGLIVTSPAIAGPAIGDVFYIELENHNLTQPSTQTDPQRVQSRPCQGLRGFSGLFPPRSFTSPHLWEFLRV